MKIPKLIEKLKGHLPISRKEYLENLAKLNIVIQGLKQSEAQHTQIELNLIQHINALTPKPINPKGKPATQEPSKDVSIQ